MATITKKTVKTGIRWMAVIRTAQIPYLSKTFKTKDAARLWAKRVETDADLAKAEACPVLRKTTLAELCDDYLLNHWKGKDPSRPALVGRWVDVLGSTRLKDLDRGKVQAALQKFKAGKAKRGDGVGADGKARVAETDRPRSGGTVNRRRAALAAVLKYGREQQGIDIDPLANVPREPESKGRKRFLSGDELAKLMAACDASDWPKLKLLVLMAIGSGARLGELQGLTWSSVDFTNRRALLTDTKNGSDRILTLPAPVITELMKFREAPRVKSVLPG